MEGPGITCIRVTRVRPVSVALKAARDKLKRFEAMGASCPRAAKDWAREEISYLEQCTALPEVVEYKAFADFKLLRVRGLTDQVHSTCAQIFEEFSEKEPLKRVVKISDLKDPFKQIRGEPEIWLNKVQIGRVPIRTGVG